MARKVYIGIDHEEPIYTTTTTYLNSLELLQSYFNIWSNYSYEFVHQGNGVFKSNNAGQYYEDSWTDDETGEEYWETEGEDAHLRFYPKVAINNLYFDWSVSSEEGCDYFFVIDDNDNELVWVSGEQSGTCGPINLSAGQGIDFYYEKDGSNDSYDDCAIISNFRIDVKTQTGTKITSYAHNINNLYIGIDNIAHHIRQAYIGVGGIARPFWGYNNVAYYGLVSGGMHQAMHPLAASSNNYAFFAGGFPTSQTTRSVYAWRYDTNLTQAQLPDMSQGQCYGTGDDFANGGGATTDTYVFLKGSYSAANNLEVYNMADLTKVTAPAIASRTDGPTLPCGFNNEVILMPGSSQNDFTVQKCSNELTVTSLPSIPHSFYSSFGAAHTYNYIIFIGYPYLGNGSYRNFIYTKNGTLMRGTISHTKYGIGSVSFDEYAIFAGGNYSAKVTIFEDSLTKLTSSGLKTATYATPGARLSENAIFAGGSIPITTTITGSSQTYYESQDQVNIYNKELVRVDSDLTLYEPRSRHNAASVGNYALFGGGHLKDYPTSHFVKNTIMAFTEI